MITDKIIAGLQFFSERCRKRHADCGASVQEPLCQDRPDIYIPGDGMDLPGSGHDAFVRTLASMTTGDGGAEALPRMAQILEGTMGLDVLRAFERAGVTIAVPRKADRSWYSRAVPGMLLVQGTYDRVKKKVTIPLEVLASERRQDFMPCNRKTLFHELTHAYDDLLQQDLPHIPRSFSRSSKPVKESHQNYLYRGDLLCSAGGILTERMQQSGEGGSSVRDRPLPGASSMRFPATYRLSSLADGRRSIEIKWKISPATIAASAMGAVVTAAAAFAAPLLVPVVAPLAVAGVLVMKDWEILRYARESIKASTVEEIALRGGRKLQIVHEGTKDRVIVPADFSSDDMRSFNGTLWSSYAYYARRKPQEYYAELGAAFNGSEESRENLKKADPEGYRIGETIFHAGKEQHRAKVFPSKFCSSDHFASLPSRPSSAWSSRGPSTTMT